MLALLAMAAVAEGVLTVSTSMTVGVVALSVGMVGASGRSVKRAASGGNATNARCRCFEEGVEEEPEEVETKVAGCRGG